MAGAFIVPWPGQGIVPPFAADGVNADEGLLVDTDTTTDPGTDDHTKHHMCALGRAIGGLGDGKAIGIISNTNRASKLGCQVFFQRFPNQPGGVGIFN